MRDPERFFWGCTGAVSAEVLRLYKFVAASIPAPDLTLNLTYFSIVAAMILVGGAWSIVLRSDSKFTAFYHGLTAPIVLSALLR